jgi:hypothetical protein
MTFEDPDDEVKNALVPRQAILMKPALDALCGEDSLADKLKPTGYGAVFIKLETAVGLGLKGPKVPKGSLS